MNRSLWNREVPYSVRRSLALVHSWNVEQKTVLFFISHSSKPIFMLFAPTFTEWLFGHLMYKQDRQCTCNITFKRLRGTNVAVEKQWALHSPNLSTLAALGIQHAMHMCHMVCPTLQYFSTLTQKRHDFRKKITEHKMCFLFFSTTFIWNIFHSKKNWARYDQKCTLIFL